MTKRRNRGDGGLSQRHDHTSCPPADDNGDRPEHRCRGRWVGTLSVKVAGKTKRKTVYGRTQQEARHKLEAGKRELAAGTLVMATDTVEAWAAYWLANIAARSVRPYTLRGYQSKIDTLIVPHLGKYKLTALKPAHVRQWHDTLREAEGAKGKPMSEASIRQAHAILRRMLKDAIYEERLATNPAERVRAPGTQQAERKVLSLTQAATLLAALPAGDLRWRLALLYGLRQGEVLALRWSDVDHDAGTLTIERSATYIRGEVTYGPPKSTRSIRDVPLLPPVELALRLSRPAGVDPDALIFTDEQGAPVTPWADNKAWHRLLDDHALPSVSLHSARHSASSLLNLVGADVKLRQSILGHAQAEVNLRYTHTELEQAREALSRVLSGLPELG